MTQEEMTRTVLLRIKYVLAESTAEADDCCRTDEGTRRENMPG